MLPWIRHILQLGASLLIVLMSFLFIPFTESLQDLLPQDPEIRVIHTPSKDRCRVPRFSDQSLESALARGVRGPHRRGAQDQLRLWYHKERARQLPGVADPAPHAEVWPAVSSAMQSDWPISKRYPVGSRFGDRIHPILGVRRFHAGVDVGAPTGTEIRAALPGTVDCACQDAVSGQYVKLDHGDALVSVYCHASELLVETGEQVEQGQVVARVGTTGRSTGPHLHYGLRIGGTWLDPVLVHNLQAAARWARLAEDTGDTGSPQ